MRLIDADACEPYFWEHLDDNGMAGALNAIAEMPTIEPRCEACEAFNKTRLLIPQSEWKKGKSQEVSNNSPEVDKENGELISRQMAIQRCDTCRHEKDQWFNRCADCFDYELWEENENGT